jgi:Mn2+/Fe2+ NRAMP family transporter
LRTNYGKTIALVFTGMLVTINLLMLVADLLAVTEALSLVLDQRRIFFVALVAYGVWNVLIFGNYQQITRSLALLSLPLFVYVLAAIAAPTSAGPIVSHTIIPHMYANASYTTAVIAVFGALLTPYVLVWQTSSRRETAVAGEELHESEHRMGAMVTTILCFCVMVVAATALRTAGDLNTPLTVKRAAQALEPAFGEIGPIIFAVGVIGAGMVALPVIAASLCYSVSEAMGWDSGLSSNPWEAKGFYVLISLAMFIAAAFNFLRLDTINVVYTSQVAAGVLAIPILLCVLLLSNDRRVMKTVNSRIQNFWIGAATGGLCATVLLLVYAKVRS